MKTLYLLGVSAAMAAVAHGAGIPNHAIANLVLGQQDFVSSSALNPTSSYSLKDPTSVIVDNVTQKVFVADEGNGRVLRYASVAALSNGAGAEAVFGKQSFGNNGDTAGQQGMSTELRGLFIDRRGGLWVADRDNNRLLYFEVAVYRSSYPYADRVLGQPDFATTSSGTTAAKMDWPQGVWVDTADRLWVADYGNNRVLRFDSISTKPSGALADGVLGQTDFVSSGGGAGAGKCAPVGVCVSPDGTLFVGDYNNNRVMRFPNAASLANGANATGVLGQPDFVTTSGGTSATKINTPGGVWYTASGSLWVLDSDNIRALRFDNASTIPSGSAASGVVGQPDFVTSDSDATNRSLGYPYYFLTLDSSGNLWIPDSANNRVLRFPVDATKPLLGVVKPPKSVTKKKIKITGTASDQFGIVRVQYKVGNGAVKNASGTTSWSFGAKLEKGKKTKIKIWAIDSVGNISLVKTVKVRRK